MRVKKKMVVLTVRSQKSDTDLPLIDNVSGVSAGILPDRKSRRQAGEIIWESDHFPPVAKFQPPTKLPTLYSVIGRVIYLTQGGKNQLPREKAVKQLALEVESKYYHDTVHCIPLRSVERKVD